MPRENLNKYFSTCQFFSFPAECSRCFIAFLEKHLLFSTLIIIEIRAGGGSGVVNMLIFELSSVSLFAFKIYIFLRRNEIYVEALNVKYRYKGIKIEASFIRIYFIKKKTK